MHGYLVNGKEKDIIQQDWKFLAILDACCHKPFKKAYGTVIGNNGTLQKAVSPASWTMEWLNKVFPDFYEDIVYVSANYFINSFNEVNRRAWLSGRRWFNGQDHFYKIIDVWHTGWNESIGTVHPAQINKAFHKAYMKYPDKRFILHYLQPHHPYITLGGHPSKEPSEGLAGTENKKKGIVKKLRDELVPQAQAWNLKKFLGMPCTSKLEEWYRKYGEKGFEGIYFMEIELVLKYVKELIDSFSGKWLITADHGERVCHPLFANHGGFHNKAVTEVPWLEIQRGETIGTYH